MQGSIKKLTLAMLVVTGVMFLGIGLNSKSLMADTLDEKNKGRDNYLNIMTVNKMQSNMINELSGDKHNVNYMFNSYKDIIKYEVTDEAIDNISNMNLFFYSGHNLEPWINNLKNKLDKNSVSINDLSRGVNSKVYNLDGKKALNPHYWNSINNYKVMLYNAKLVLQEADPANRDYYEANYNKMLKKVDSLKDEFKNKKEFKKLTFLVRDRKFDYLLNELGVKYVLLGKEEDITKFCKRNNLNRKDLVLIKEKDSKVIRNDNKFKNIILKSYDGKESYYKLLKSNLNSLEKAILKNK